MAKCDFFSSALLLSVAVKYLVLAVDNVVYHEERSLF